MKKAEQTVSHSVRQEKRAHIDVDAAAHRDLAAYARAQGRTPEETLHRLVGRARERQEARETARHAAATLAGLADAAGWTLAAVECHALPDARTKAAVARVDAALDQLRAAAADLLTRIK